MPILVYLCCGSSEAFECTVQLVGVGLMVLEVVDFHGVDVDGGSSVIFVRERRSGRFALTRRD